MAATRDRTHASGATSSEEWGRRLRRGDVDAVRHVRDRVGRILSHKRLGIPDHERDDLEQEVMAELWRAVNRAGFDFTAGFWGFVEVVTSRRCIDWLRSRRVLVPLPEAAPHQGRSPFDGVLETERAQIAADVLRHLDLECRKIILMRLREDIPYRRIAEILGKSEGAVRVQMYRCIRHAHRIVQAMHPSLVSSAEEGRSDGTS
jgi:RNA polymerase sigma-70 factor (ECF subfamily)